MRKSALGALAIGFLLSGFATAPRGSTSQGARLELEILGTTDLHGHIYPTTYFHGEKDEDLGLAKVATLVKRERAQGKNVLLVDSGDLLQGSPLTDWFAHHADWRHQTNPLIAALNHLGCAAFSVGNHDFNYGLPFLYQARKDARFPFLSANIYRHGSDEPVFNPYVMVKVAGLKVGIIGATEPGVALEDREFVQGKMDFGDIVAAFAKRVPEARARGADLVIGIPHSGMGGDGRFGPTYSGYDPSTGLPPENVGLALASRVPGIDALLLGHSHLVIDGIGNDLHGQFPAVVQAGLWGKRLAACQITLERQGTHWVVLDKRTTTLSVAGVPADPAVLAICRDAHLHTLEYVREPIARTPVRWEAKHARIEDTPIVELINRVQQLRSHADLSAAAAFDTSAELGPGDISIAQVAAIYPYENNLVAVAITGEKLRAYLEQAARYFAPYREGESIYAQGIGGYNFDMVTGVDYELDLSHPFGSRVTKLDYHGKPVSPEQTFTLALNSYRQVGGGGYTMLRGCPVVYNRSENIRDLIVEFLRQQHEIKPEDVFLPSWRLAPAGAIDPVAEKYR